MSPITRVTNSNTDLLANTLNLVALARQTALEKGERAQADQFAPVEGKLRDLVKETRQQQYKPLPQSRPPINAAPSSPAVQAAGGITASQTDFQSLLAAKRASPAAGSAASRGVNETPTGAAERNQIVAAMASGGMDELEIARHMGLTREEVRLIVNTAAITIQTAASNGFRR